MHPTTTPEFAALMGLDWGDRSHAIALQAAGGDIQTSTLPHSAESLHQWLDQLEKAYSGRPVAVAIEAHLERLAEQGHLPQFHFLAGAGVAELRLSRLAKVTLYRIAVEAIHNVQRHASASRFEVGLERRSDCLVMSVEDNGRGFDFVPRLPGEFGGRGLHNIRERARAIGAQVAWGPARFSSGTRFELQMPLDVDNRKGGTG